MHRLTHDPQAVPWDARSNSPPPRPRPTPLCRIVAHCAYGRFEWSCCRCRRRAWRRCFCRLVERAHADHWRARCRCARGYSLTWTRTCTCTCTHGVSHTPLSQSTSVPSHPHSHVPLLSAVRGCAAAGIPRFELASDSQVRRSWRLNTALTTAGPRHMLLVSSRSACFWCIKFRYPCVCRARLLVHRRAPSPGLTRRIWQATLHPWPRPKPRPCCTPSTRVFYRYP